MSSPENSASRVASGLSSTEQASWDRYRDTLAELAHVEDAVARHNTGHDVLDDTQMTVLSKRADELVEQLRHTRPRLGRSPD